MRRNRLLAISLAAGILLWALPGPASASPVATDLVSVTFVKEAPGVVFSVLIRGEFGNEAFKLREPDRLVVDISPIDGMPAPEQSEINAGGVLRVRTGRFQADVARVVFDLDGPDVLYRIDRTADGLKVTFWKEGAVAAKPEAKPLPPAEPKPAPKAEEKPPAPPATPPRKPAEAPIQETAMEPAPAPGFERTEKGFFAALGVGIGTFLSTETPFLRSFAINGKQGTAESIYTPKLDTPAALSLGKYVRLQDMDIKLGLDVEYWNFKSEGRHVFTIPHPLLADSERTLETTNAFRSYFTSVSAFALVRLFSRGALTVRLGPEIGYATGKYKFLDVIDIADGPPFTEAELSIRQVTYADKTASSVLAGLRAGFEYDLSSKLSILLDVKALYFSPEIGELSSKLDLSQAFALLGIQYNF